MIRIESAGPKITSSEVEALESKLGIELPLAYRNFLVHHNGGRALPDTVDVPGLDGSPTDIQIFFGIDRRELTSNIEWNAIQFASLLRESELVPIACDSGGNLFCVSNVAMAGDGGSIWFVELGHQLRKRYLVASDFERFLDKIREY